VALTDVSAQPIGPIYKGQTAWPLKMVPEAVPKRLLTTNQHCVTSQKGDDVIYQPSGNRKCHFVLASITAKGNAGKCAKVGIILKLHGIVKPGTEQNLLRGR
jgi:hypothetical protein